MRRSTGGRIRLLSGAGNPRDSGPGRRPAVAGRNGFGTVTVGPAGIAHFAGRLADGAVVSEAAQISTNGLWPLYAPLYLGNGSVLSWLAFTNQAGSDFNGSLSWIRSSNPKARYYAGGFTNVCNTIGSAYVPPVRTNILDLSAAQLEFAGGDLENSFTNFLAIGRNSSVHRTATIWQWPLSYPQEPITNGEGSFQRKDLAVPGRCAAKAQRRLRLSPWHESQQRGCFRAVIRAAVAVSPTPGPCVPEA